MIQYLILAKIKDHSLFAQYIKGHIPTIAQFGGKVVFRSTENAPILGSEHWDVVAIQEWPNPSAFDLWWASDEYKPWAKIRDQAASLVIIKCQNNLLA